MSRSIMIVAGVVLMAVLLVFIAEELFRRKIGGFAGSYPFAETWEINATEADVVNAIIALKTDNPKLRPPGEVDFVDTRDTGYIWSSPDMQQYLEKIKTDSTTPLPEPDYANYYHDYWLVCRLLLSGYEANNTHLDKTWNKWGCHYLCTGQLYIYDGGEYAYKPGLLVPGKPAGDNEV